MALTPLAVSALAMLVERPMHPYEMYHLLLERHEDRVVRVTAGSLYRTMDKLTVDGLAEVTGVEREGNRPERTTYAVTEAGRLALVARIREILCSPVNEYPTFALAVSEAHNVAADAVGADLQTHLQGIEADLAEIDRLIEMARSKGIPERWWITADYIRHMTIAQRDWITGFAGRLETGDLPWPQTNQ